MSMFPIPAPGNEDPEHSANPTSKFYRRASPFKWTTQDRWCHLLMAAGVALSAVLAFIDASIARVIVPVTLMIAIFGYVAWKAKLELPILRSALKQVKVSSGSRSRLHIPARSALVPAVYISVLAAFACGEDWMWLIGIIGSLVVSLIFAFNRLLRFRSIPVDSVEARTELEAAAFTLAVLFPASYLIGLLFKDGLLQDGLAQHLWPEILDSLWIAPMAFIGIVYGLTYFVLRKLR